MNPTGSRTPNALQYFWLAHGLLLLTIYGSLIPLRYEWLPLDEALQQFREIKFHDPNDTGARGDWVVNMIQYATVSFCYMGALGVDRRWVLQLLTAALVIAAGWATAVALEFLQIYFPPRTVAVNDILVECIGVLLGTGAWLLIGQWFTNWLRRFWDLKGLSGLATQLLPLYLGLLLLVYLMPFDFVFNRAELVEKYRQGRIQLMPFGNVTLVDFKSWLNLLRPLVAFLPLGALLALVPRCSGWNWKTVARVGLAVTALILLCQLAVYTRHCDVTNMLIGTSAVVLGWWFVQGLRDPLTAKRHGLAGVYGAFRSLRENVARWKLGHWVILALAWGAFVALVSWQPFDFTTDPARFLESDPDLSDENTPVFGWRRMFWAPLLDYYWGSRYHALDQFVWRSLSFAPLGILVAQACGRRERLGAFVAVLSGLALAVVVEFGKYFVPERHPSTTSLLIQVGGAWLGYKVARLATHALAPVPVVPSETQFLPSPGTVGTEPDSGAPSWNPLAFPPRHDGGSSSRSILPNVPQRNQDRKNAFLAWFDAQPNWFQIALMALAAFLVPVGIVLLCRAIGLL